MSLAADVRYVIHHHDFPPTERRALHAAAAMLDLFDKVYEALPPCEHCGGERMQRLASAILNAEAKLAEPCSCAATDHPGLQPFAEWCKELAALWTAAHSLSPGTRIQAALDAARQVRAR